MYRDHARRLDGFACRGVFFVWRAPATPFERLFEPTTCFGLMTIDGTWIVTTGTAALMVVLTALSIYGVLLLFTRLFGLRSFSKMSSFDFAITVAIGSLIATVILSKNPPLVQGVVGLAALFLIQAAVATLRNHSRAVQRVVDNEALLLMRGDEILHANMKKARVTENDLKAKLRAANVIHPGQVRAVVMESTGDISVLHADPDGPALDPDLLSDVHGAERWHEGPNA